MVHHDVPKLIELPFVEGLSEQVGDHVRGPDQVWLFTGRTPRRNACKHATSAQGFRVNQSVYTTAATRAATWSTAPVYCPFRVNYKVHTQLTLLHYCGYSTVVPSYHTPTLLVHID